MAVFMGEVGISILSGMFTAFPALSTSTLIAVKVNRVSGGTESGVGMTMSMMVSIMLMPAPYSIIVHFLYPSLGIAYGTVIAYAIAIAIGVPYYWYAKDFVVPSFANQN